MIERVNSTEYFNNCSAAAAAELPGYFPVNLIVNTDPIDHFLRVCGKSGNGIQR